MFFDYFALLIDGFMQPAPALAMRIKWHRLLSNVWSEGAGKDIAEGNEENRASSNDQWLSNARLAPFFAITVALWFSPDHRFPAFYLQFLSDFCLMADMSPISAIENS